MKKFLKIFLGILFLALLVGTFVFLWNLSLIHISEPTRH